jgi:5-methylcytosine-specific restriction endonuclease McrA
MPTLLRACSGCSEPTVKSPCDNCSRSREQRRGSRQERGYTEDWLRDAALFRKFYPFCGMRPNGESPVMSKCHDEGRVTPAFQTDHVVPHRGTPALFMDRSKRVKDQPNWQSLCRECGARKSAAGL